MKPGHILFVCTGNTCRSPMCAALYNAQNAVDGSTARSAGLYADGTPISRGAANALAQRAIDGDWRTHISHTVTAEDIAWADCICGVTPAHAMQLKARFPTDSDKIIALPLPIADPYGGDDVLYLATLDDIATALSLLFPAVEVPTESTITVSEADVRALDAILAIENEAFTVPWSEKSFLTAFADPHIRIFTATDADGAIGGFACLALLEGEGELLNIATAPSHRRRGIGSALLRRVIDDAMEAGVESLFLEVRESNVAAQTLYTKHGFVPIGRRRQYYTKPTEDAILMHKPMRIL